MAVKDYLLTEVPGKKLQVGEQFPEFELWGHDFEKHTLEQLKKKRKVVLVFPSLETSICSLQLKTMAGYLNKQNTLLVGISSDSVITTSKWCTTQENKNVLGLSLFNDNQKLAKALGVYLPVCDFLTFRAAFVLDENNKVVYAQYAQRLKTELDLEEVLKHLK